MSTFSVDAGRETALVGAPDISVRWSTPETESDSSQSSSSHHHVTISGHTLRKTAAIALAVIAIFNLLDVLTTQAMLAHGAIESNPLAKMLLPDGKVDVIKALVVGLLAWRVLKSRPSIVFTAALWFGAGFYFLTVLSNLLILQRLA